jgi:hypothetical protein
MRKIKMMMMMRNLCGCLCKCVFDIPAEVGVGSKTKISKIDNFDTGLGLSLSK